MTEDERPGPCGPRRQSGWCPAGAGRRLYISEGVALRRRLYIREDADPRQICAQAENATSAPPSSRGHSTH